MKKRTVELLAPAGSYESMVAAVNAGADAVYIGGNKFGARAYANNLDEEAMIRAIDFVHLHGCKIYMTVNTLVKEKELLGLHEYLEPYYEAGLDAVLIQDLGVLSYIRDHFPDLPIHISTQMTVTGAYSAAELKKLGAVRVVPARELSLEEIRTIVRETGLEVETFVHGALCYCYSGQCLFSSLIGGRSGNRGRCAQTCRLPFDVLGDGKLLNKKNERYVLSLKDLCTLDILPDILESGVCSLKIEGRMKSPRYTAGVVSIYRKYVDLYLEKGRAGYHVEEADRKTLLALFDRGGQSQGYYEKHNGRDMVVLKEKPEFRETDQALFDYLDRTYVETVRKVKIRGTAFFEVGKPARLYGEYALLEAEAAGKPAERVLPGAGPSESCAGSGQKAAAAASLLVWVEGDAVEAAKNAPMDEARIRKQLLKTGESPFEFEELLVTVRGDVFLPMQALNKLRRELLEAMEKEIKARFHRPARGSSDVDGSPDDGGREESSAAELVRIPGPDQREAKLVRIPGSDRSAAPEFTALVSNRAQFEAVLRLMCRFRREDGGTFSIYLASEEFGPESWKNLTDRCHESGIGCYLMMPRIFRKEAEQYFLKNMETLKAAGFDAVGVASMEEPGFLKEHLPEVPRFFDHGMYTFNHLAETAMQEYGAARTTIPVELNEREIREAGLKGELLVYGRLPMMVSAQCIRRTTAGCSHKPELLYLKDRKGKSFPVRNQCRFCYNTIYNESPLSLHGLAKEVYGLAPEALRLNFTVEDEKTTEAVLSAFYREFVRGEVSEAPVREFTRGHFRRGVE